MRQKKLNGLAFVGLFFGILSMVCCCLPVFFPLGIVFSKIAIRQIETNPEYESGLGMAYTGLVLSTFSFIIFTALVIFLVYSIVENSFQGLEQLLQELERFLDAKGFPGRLPRTI